MKFEAVQPSFPVNGQMQPTRKVKHKVSYNDFFEIFDVKRRSVARYEEHVKKLNNKSGFIDLFWPGVLLVEQKSAGHNLADAYGQAGDYFDALPERERPRYILVSDFQKFELHDLDTREQTDFTLKDLPSHVENFGFILGVERKTFRDQDPANIKAAELVGHLHDTLKEAGYQGHDLERFLVRIVFCLFADDTGIFEPRDIFLDFIETRTREDGSDLGPMLTQLFQVLDTPDDKRSTILDQDLAHFPYVNGDLFREPLRIPSFNKTMRRRLLEACYFDWSNISPAIFGALFQSVMEPAERRAQGAHYTIEKNILKVVEPLFLDDLREEFKRLRQLKRGRESRLQSFQEKLSQLTFFDPACGCGNFLIIAYRELRQLEIEVIRELRTGGNEVWPSELDATILSQINVDQFYGIELGEFPVRIAETALWMMDHIMNNRLSLEFGQTYARIPLRKSPHIVVGNALDMDWQELLPSEKCTYLFGNPPFVGHQWRTKEQQHDMVLIWGSKGQFNRLDYVTCWFNKGARYAARNQSIEIAFVSTNSITQGEQCGILWPVIFAQRLSIRFAHRTFQWNSEARGSAAVHCVIIGLTSAKDGKRFIYEYDPCARRTAFVGSSTYQWLLDQRSAVYGACPFQTTRGAVEDAQGQSANGWRSDQEARRGLPKIQQSDSGGQRPRRASGCRSELRKMDNAICRRRRTDFRPLAMVSLVEGCGSVRVESIETGMRTPRNVSAREGFKARLQAFGITLITRPFSRRTGNPNQAI